MELRRVNLTASDLLAWVMVPGGRLARAAAIFVRRILPELAEARNRFPRATDPEPGRSLLEAGREPGAVDAVSQLLALEIVENGARRLAAQVMAPRLAEPGGVRREQEAALDPGLAPAKRVDQGLTRGGRLLRQDVEPGAADPALAQRALQRRKIDQAAACRVDQERAGLERRERCLVQQVSGLLGERAVQAERVRLRQQRRQIGRTPQPDPELGAIRQIRVVERDVHVQRTGPARRGGADPAEPDDAEAGAAQPPDQRRARPVPAAMGIGQEPLLVRDQAARQAQQQRDRVIGDLGRAVVRHVAHRDAAGAARREIDLVVADPGPHHDPTTLEPVHDVPVDRHLVIDDQRVGGAPARVRDAIGAALAMDGDLSARAERLALDQGIVLVLGVGQQDQHEFSYGNAWWGPGRRTYQATSTRPDASERRLQISSCPSRSTTATCCRRRARRSPGQPRPTRDPSPM